MKDFRLANGDSLIVKELMTNESANRRDYGLAISDRNLMESNIIYIGEIGESSELTRKATLAF